MAAPHFFSLSQLPVSKALTAHPKDVNILTLDGGGMRGLFSLDMLKAIVTSMFGGSGDEETRSFVKLFDLIGGTSTGAIIAVGLRAGHSIDHIRATYTQLGTTVFATNSITSPYRWARYMYDGNYYDGKALHTLFEASFNNNGLKQFDSKLFVTATDSSTSQWAPFILRSYSPPHDIYGGTDEIDVPTALRATSAAPTYFSPVKLGDKTLVDGGCIVNNPTECAVFEAHHLFPERRLNCILSIGTGIPTVESSSANVYSVVNNIINIATSSRMANERVKEWIQISPDPPGYFRYSPEDGVGSLRLDCTDPTKLAEGSAKTVAYMKDQQESVDKLAQQLRGDV